MSESLLNSTDFARFQAKDPAWFLGAAGETIRDYCSWHIAPLQSDLGVKAWVGAAGIVMLPTLNLVSVEQITVGGNVIPATGYEAHDSGWIELFGAMQGFYVLVNFTHGFEELPKTVAEVGYELTGRTLEKPAGVVKHMTRGPIDMDFLEFGAVLSDDQKARLAPYTLLGV